jgi:putative heme-binding domain-containing protein
MRQFIPACVLVVLSLLLSSASAQSLPNVEDGARIAIIGNTLADRMQHDGWFEAYMQNVAAGKKYTVRNLGFSADALTVRQRNADYGSPNQRLSEIKADVVLLMFGFNESFKGPQGISQFRKDLTETINSMLNQKYNGSSAPQLVLVSPIAHEDHKNPNLPNGEENNRRLRMYVNVMKNIAANRDLPFVDLFTPTLKAYSQSGELLTINGVHLNDAGNKLVGKLLVDSLFGSTGDVDESRLQQTCKAVKEKNFYWYNYYRTVDGYSMYGKRADLVFTDGQTNRVVMRRELDVLMQLTDNRDPAIWAAAKGEDYSVDDSNLPEYLPVVTNKRGTNPDGTFKFPSGVDAAKQMKVLDGFSVNLFASEEMFPELINPVQMSFDSKGRLWVAAWESYPHWKPTEKMNDKLLILEDTDNDGVADSCKVFADGLHNPTGFEFHSGGVVVAMAPEILFLKDTDGDDKADQRTMVLHGFDTADTHHAANSFAFGPGGGIHFQEGIFQFTQSETPYGPVRNRDAAIYRFDPRTSRLEVYANHPFVNPHGHVFDKWGQDIILDGTMAVPYAGALASGYMPWPNKRSRAPSIYNPRTRPCPAAEIVSSDHFSAEYQNELLVQNVIGDVGILRYKVSPDGSSISAKELEPLLLSDDPTFRPVDLEFGPRGDLFFVDWCNPIIGHMQHNLRDPNRDQAHGRVYRITQNGRPLGTSPDIDGQPVSELLKVLEQPVERIRYRTRIEISGRETDEVIKATKTWLANRNTDSEAGIRASLEGLWIHQQHNVLHLELLDQLLGCSDHRARAAATRVLSHWRYLVEGTDMVSRATKMAADESPNVRLEAARLASFLTPEDGLSVLVKVRAQPTDKYLDYVVEQSIRAWGDSWKATLLDKNLLAGADANSADWFLDQVDVKSLKNATIDSTIGRHLMFRDGVGLETRTMAIQRVSQAESKSPVDVIVEMLEGASKDRPGISTTRELVGILAKRPQDELTPVRDRLKSMSLSGEIPIVRQIGFAGSMLADGNPESSWKVATDSNRRIDFIQSLALIGDPSLQQLVYTKLQPVALGEGNGGSKKESPTAKFVRIELPGEQRILTLAEVQVYANAKNIAPSGTASQINVEHGGSASKAIDGGTSGSYSSGVSTHTNTCTDPWWELELDESAVVYNVKIYNRTEGDLGQRLNGFRLKLLDESRNVIFEQADNPAPEESVSIRTESMGEAERLQRAALEVIASVRGKEKENAKVLIDLIVNDRLSSTACNALTSIPGQYWPEENAQPLLKQLIKKVQSIPAAKRNQPRAAKLIKLAQTAAGLLPKELATAARSEIDGLGVRTVAIGTRPHRMAYDIEQIVVRPGQTIEINFENTDSMPHNLVIVQPGTLEAVGVAAENGGSKLANAPKPFVPEMKEILLASGLVQQSESQSIVFETPNEPGVYPFVCTYPGHWRRMYGAFYVVNDPAAFETNSDKYLADSGIEIRDEILKMKRTTTEWKLADFESSFGEDFTKDRNFNTGQQMFKMASCISCHQMNDKGVNIGQNLEELNPEYKPVDVLKHILDPSLKIDPKYQTHKFMLESGEVISGLVVFEDNLMLRYIDNPLAGGDPKVLRIAKIEDRNISKTSIMPTGLLDQLTRDEVLDLVAYVMAKGEKDDKIYQNGHNH